MFLFQVCTLTEFLLDTVSLETYSDTPSEHLPSLFLQIVTLLTDHCDTLSPVQTAKSLQLCAKILTRVQPAILAHSQILEIGSVSTTTEQSEMLSVKGSSRSLPGKAERSQSTFDTSAADSISVSSDIQYSEKSGRDSSQSKEICRLGKCEGEDHNILEQCLRQYER